MNNLSVRTRLGLLVAFSVAALLLVGLGGWVGIGRVGAALSDIGDNKLPAVSALSEIRAQQYALYAYTLEAATWEKEQYANSHFKDILERKAKAAARFDKALKDYAAGSHSADEEKAWNTLQPALKRWREFDTKLNAVIATLGENSEFDKQAGIFEQYYLSITDWKDAQYAVERNLGKLVEINVRDSLAARQTGATAHRTAKGFMSSIFAVAHPRPDRAGPADHAQHRQTARSDAQNHRYGRRTQRLQAPRRREEPGRSGSDRSRLQSADRTDPEFAARSPRQRRTDLGSGPQGFAGVEPGLGRLEPAERIGFGDGRRDRTDDRLGQPHHRLDPRCVAPRRTSRIGSGLGSRNHLGHRRRDGSHRSYREGRGHDDRRAGRPVGTNLGDHAGDPRSRRPDQPARLERGDRSGPRRRTGTGASRSSPTKSGSSPSGPARRPRKSRRWSSR